MRQRGEGGAGIRIDRGEISHGDSAKIIASLHCGRTRSPPAGDARGRSGVCVTSERRAAAHPHMRGAARVPPGEWWTETCDGGHVHVRGHGVDILGPFGKRCLIPWRVGWRDGGKTLSRRHGSGACGGVDRRCPLCRITITIKRSLYVYRNVGEIAVNRSGSVVVMRR